jgi:hypothetical protein
MDSARHTQSDFWKLISPKGQLSKKGRHIYIYILSIYIIYIYTQQMTYFVFQFMRNHFQQLVRQIQGHRSPQLLRGVPRHFCFVLLLFTEAGPT